MLIDIPDDLARKAKLQVVEDAATHRRWAKEWERDGQHHNAVLSLVDAALADLPEPIRVGHLAHANDYTFLVLALGRERAFLEDHEGWETSRPIADLTYAGPKPQGWGRQ